MDNLLTTVSQKLVDLVVLLVNGVLVIVYTIAGHTALLTALASALVVHLLIDPWVEARAAHPLRVDGWREESRQPPYQRRLTLVTLGLWFVASLMFPTPVPWHGALMWVAGLAGLLLFPADRIPLAWRVKSMIITYALVLMGFRFLLVLLASTSPRDWASLLGSSGEAGQIIGSNASMVIAIGTWVAWYGLPAAELWYLLQRALVHPMSLVNPMQTAAEIVDEIRTRGQD